MTDHLWLQLPRDRVVERGYGVTQRPLDVANRLTGTFGIDPLTGYATARVTPSMQGAWGWAAGPSTGSGQAWLACTPFVLPDGTYAGGIAHRGKTPFSITSSGGPAAGCGWFFGFLCYGGGKPFRVMFGANVLWFDGGKVTWIRGGRQVGEATLWHAEEWETTIHYLYVYAIGNRLAARRLGHPERSGLDVGMLVETDAADAAAALPAGPVTVAGEGYLTFGLAPERHETAFDLRHATIVLPEGSTMEPALAASALVPAGGALDAAMVGPDGVVWSSPPEPPYTGCGYRVTATLPSATGPNLYLTRVRLRFPEKVENDEAPPVDLAEFEPVGFGGTGVVQQVEIRRGPDAQSCGLTMQLLTVPGDVAPYLQPHMKGRWEPDGTAWLTFYTNRPQLSGEGPQDTLTIDCESGWKLFQTTRWAGDGSYAGRPLAEAYRDVARKAGMAADEIVIAAGTPRLPAEDPDQPALFDFQPGQTLDQILTYLHDQFGSGDRLCFKADGKLYIEPKPAVASGVVFGWETPGSELAAVATATSTLPLIREWDEAFDEEGLANDVWVVGQHRSGEPLVAIATDWPSVRERLARNYVAGFRRLTILDAGLTSQGLVNWVARNVLERVRRPRLTARMTGTAVAGLYEQDLIEIAGRGIWRVMSLAVTWSDGAPHGIGSYQLEYVGEGS